MNEAIIERLNSCVKPGDTLYFLGDFCLGSPRHAEAHRNRLASKTIHFVEGNHDKAARKRQSLFASWSSLAEIHVGKQGIVLCHYAMRGASGTSMATRTAICRTTRCPCRWMSGWTRMIFVRGISMKFRQ